MSDEPQKAPEESIDSTAWMATFSDLLALMLTFFVLLLTMSSMDDQKIKQLTRPGLQITNDLNAESISVSTGLKRPKIVEKHVLDITRKVELTQTELMASVHESTEEIVVRYDLDEKGWITRRADGVEVHVQGDFAFKKGDDRLSVRGQNMINELVLIGTAARMEMHVVTYVERGDGIVEREQGWDLALRRADRVASHALGKGFDSGKLQIMGYGYSAGRDEQRFLRQSELLSVTFALPKDAPAAAPFEPSTLEQP